MKTVLLLSIVLGGALGAKLLCCGTECCFSSQSESDAQANSTAAERAPFGAYFEARNASVYGGACHYNGELTTQGQSAVLAWRLEGGAHDGVSLGGVEVAAAVTASDNLKTDAARRSVIYVDTDASEAQREAAVGWLRDAHGAALGDVLAVESVALELASDGEHFRAKIGAAFELCGSAMPDRECCKMPYNVWYEPIEKLEGRLVAATSHFAWRETRLAANFERSGHNDAFIGRFGESTVAADGSCCASTPPSRVKACAATNASTNAATNSSMAQP